MASLQAIIRENDRRKRAVVRETLRVFMGRAKQYHVGVTAQWTNKPDWRLMYLYPPDEMIGRLVSTDSKSEIWRYVDEGTGRYGPSHAPYYIFPKLPTGLLKFQQFYSARTQPVARYGTGTGTKYGPWLSKPFVLHPGIEPREFTKTFAEKQKGVLSAMILLALGRQ